LLQPVRHVIIKAMLIQVLKRPAKNAERKTPKRAFAFASAHEKSRSGTTPNGFSQKCERFRLTTGMRLEAPGFVRPGAFLVAPISQIRQSDLQYAPLNGERPHALPTIARQGFGVLNYGKRSTSYA